MKDSTETGEPGNYGVGFPNFLGKVEDPEARKSKLAAELANGRLAMMAPWLRVSKERLRIHVHAPVSAQLDNVTLLKPFLPCLRLTLKRHGTAHGPDGIPAELLQVLQPESLPTVHEIIAGVHPTPEEWKESYLAPIPKKGGILLTSVPGRVFAKIVKGRLVAHMEAQRVLTESQSGLGAGRGTVDMISNLYAPQGFGTGKVREDRFVCVFRGSYDGL